MHQDNSRTGYSRKEESKYIFRAGMIDMLEKIASELYDEKYDIREKGKDHRLNWINQKVLTWMSSYGKDL